MLKPGDTIRTGRNGRVLLMRGEETILISPNSIIGIPMEPKDGLSTTIIQQAGSILLEVEKRNVKHFEVETPYFAAVVKGTQFRVSVERATPASMCSGARSRWRISSPASLRRCCPAKPRQALARGRGGLSLSGSGTFNPIQQGQPRARQRSSACRSRKVACMRRKASATASRSARSKRPEPPANCRSVPAAQPSRPNAPVHSQVIRLIPRSVRSI